MTLTAHIIQSVVASTLLYPVIGENIIPFALAVVFIDLDHVIQYVYDTMSINMRGFFIYFNLIIHNADKKFLGFSIFHTIEFYALLFLAGSEFSFCYYVLMGCLFHHTFDQYWLTKKYKRPAGRVFSILEYFIRKRSGKYITSIREILQEENLDLTGVTNLEKWMIDWSLLSSDFIFLSLDRIDSLLAYNQEHSRLKEEEINFLIAKRQNTLQHQENLFPELHK